MMTALFILLGILVITGVSLLAVGRFGSLPDVDPALVPEDLPTDRALRGADLQQVRFDVGVRGYRMDEVDTLLDRLAADLAEKDATIASLRDQVAESPTAVMPRQPLTTDAVGGDGAPSPVHDLPEYDPSRQPNPYTH